MTPETVVKAAQEYLVRLQKNYPNSAPVRTERREKSGHELTLREQVDHIHWALLHAVELAKEGNVERAKGLLSFAHGFLWAMGLASINDGKRANMPEGLMFDEDL